MKPIHFLTVLLLAALLFVWLLVGGYLLTKFLVPALM